MPQRTKPVARRRRPLAEVVGDRIRELRDERVLSRKGLAERGRVSLTSLVLIEQGRLLPRLSTLEAVASALGVRVAELLEDAPAPAAPSPTAKVFVRLVERLRRHADDREWLACVERLVVAFENAVESKIASMSVVDRIGSLASERRPRA